MNDRPLSLTQRRHLAALADGPLRPAKSFDDRDRTGNADVLVKLHGLDFVRIIPGSWDGVSCAYELTSSGLLAHRLVAG